LLRWQPLSICLARWTEGSTPSRGNGRGEARES